MVNYQCPEHKELTENFLRKSTTVLSLYHMHSACVCERATCTRHVCAFPSKNDIYHEVEHNIGQ